MKHIEQLFDELKEHPEFITAQIYTVRGVISDFYDAYCDLEEEHNVVEDETISTQMIHDFIITNKNMIRKIILSNDEEYYYNYIDESLKQIFKKD